MGTTDKVTIAILVYERSEYFQEALESALNQTVQCPIIVCDNASSHNKFRNLCATYPDRVVYHRNAENIGMFGNYNTAVQLSRTEFTMILGDDDILYPDFISNFLITYSQYQNIGVYYTNFNVLYEPEHEIKPNFLPTYWGGNTDMFHVKKYGVKHSLGFPSISCVVKTDLMKNPPFETRVHSMNDWYLLYHLPDETEVYCNEEVQLIYRKHSKSDTNRKEMAVVLHLSGHLIMYDLASDSKYDAPIANKLKWINIIHQLFRHERAAIEDFLQRPSYYKTIYERLRKNIWWKLWPLLYIRYTAIPKILRYFKR